MPTAAGPLVAVVGGGIAGMAAGARLAKMGHRVVLHEGSGRLGGRWAPYLLEVPAPDGPAPDDTALGSTGLLVDDAPGVLGFPAPWRDLFRKSGRPLETELARSGQGLVPAPAPTYRFADGTELVLPSDRGEQHEALSRAYGPGPADRWQQLLDSLGTVWQALRPLGLEEAYDPKALTHPVVRRLRGRLGEPHSLAELADTLDEAHLRALVRSTAHRQGTTPEQAPALAAVELLVGRTFGRWQIRPESSARNEATTGDVGRTSLLVEALAARLALRGVDVRLGSRVVAVPAGRDGIAGVETSVGLEPADAVILTVDPWSAAELAPPGAAGRLRRALRGATAARLPAPLHTVSDDGVSDDGGSDDRGSDDGGSDDRIGGDDVRERVSLDDDGVPVVETTRRLSGRVVRTVHDHHVTAARPGSGLVTAGFRGWRRRPGTSSGVPGLALAGAASPAGPSPSAVVQSAALAAYAVAGRRD